MACEKATEEELNVVVEIPKPLHERRRECWNRFSYAIARSRFRLVFVMASIIASLAVFFSPLWVWILMGYCESEPGLILNDVNLHEMVVFQNTTMATTDTAFQVRSDMSLNLIANNSNTIRGCFITFRSVSVTVDYKGQRVLEQVVPFPSTGLKPKEFRNVTLALKSDGNGNMLNNNIASLLKLKLQNVTGLVELGIFMKARYLQHDRRSFSVHMGCDTNVKPPPTFSGGLLLKSC